MEKQIRYDREVEEEVAARRNALFNQHIMPYRNMIYKLCMRYSDNMEDVEENYTIVLTTLFRGIETYNPERSIRTWIHIVTKRQVYELNRRAAKINKADKLVHMDNVLNEDGEYEPALELIPDDIDRNSPQAMTMENYRQCYSDDVLRALDSLKPIYRDALLLQEAGYSLREIADIQYQQGALVSNNIDTVKSRLFLARQSLRNMLTRDGIRRNKETHS
jgi:RNA polymerase sigma factor (sigma-70 family)